MHPPGCQETTSCSIKLVHSVVKVQVPNGRAGQGSDGYTAEVGTATHSLYNVSSLETTVLSCQPPSHYLLKQRQEEREMERRGNPYHISHVYVCRGVLARETNSQEWCLPLELPPRAKPTSLGRLITTYGSHSTLPSHNSLSPRATHHCSMRPFTTRQLLMILPSQSYTEY